MDVALVQTQSSVGLSVSSPEVMDCINQMQRAVLAAEQLDIATEHVFHGGMYARTMRVPAGAVLVGVTIQLPTLLIVSGDAMVLAGDEWLRLTGYNVLAGSTGRKALMAMMSDVAMTMLFPTELRTVQEAEREFTDEYELLMSRRSTHDTVLVTEE